MLRPNQIRLTIDRHGEKMVVTLRLQALGNGSTEPVSGGGQFATSRCVECLTFPRLGVASYSELCFLIIRKRDGEICKLGPSIPVPIPLILRDSNYDGLANSVARYILTLPPLGTSPPAGCSPTHRLPSLSRARALVCPASCSAHSAPIGYS